MRRALAALAPLALAAACAAPTPDAGPRTTSVDAMGFPNAVLGADPYADPDYPYPLGRVDVVLDGRPIAWGVYDYSVGAVDPAATIAADAARTLRIGGDRPEVRRTPPDREVGELLIAGEFRGEPGPRALAAAVVSVTPGRYDEDLPFLTSAGGPAEVVVEAYEPAEGGARFGRIAGRFSATLCRAASRAAAPDRAACVPVSGTFDTQVYDDR